MGDGGAEMSFLRTAVHMVEVIMCLLRARSRFRRRSFLAVQVPGSVLFSAVHGTVLWDEVFGDQMQVRREEVQQPAARSVLRRD